MGNNVYFSIQNNMYLAVAAAINMLVMHCIPGKNYLNNILEKIFNLFQKIVIVKFSNATKISILHKVIPDFL